ncbi:hypothetical protein F5Y04DRAFT_283135 [Hypomontagnella monticulosa]|nr:hypothetical protein F5Y04DRAFT_283135 [Hypomontagnella monticulosa]
MKYYHILPSLIVASISAVSSEDVNTTWTNSEAGNLTVIFSDDRINLGSIQIDQVLDSLYDKCSEGGMCDTGDITLPGELLSGGDVESVTATIRPSGNYHTWIRNGLLEAVRAAVTRAADCSNVTHEDRCPDARSYCPDNTITHHQCIVPRFWGVSYQQGDADDAPQSLNANVQVKYGDNGFCKTFTIIGAGVAGAIGIGPISGIFTVSTLLCQT